MAVSNDLVRVSPDEFLNRIRTELIPVNRQFSFFQAGTALGDEDVREYINDPIAAIPAGVSELLPRVGILLVPYLEAGGKEEENGDAAPKPRARERKPAAALANGRNTDAEGVHVLFQRPPENRKLPWASLRMGEQSLLLFAVEDMDVADYHYHLFHELARIASTRLTEPQLRDYNSLLREELISGVNGEVDDQSWTLKQALRRRQTNMKRETKGFLDYAKESFVDTLTLYMHGLCCDIDVETGPRQLPSRFLRKRLEAIEDLFPPPKGYALFPEDLEDAADGRETAAAPLETIQ
jgi:hypothetical protein